MLKNLNTLGARFTYNWINSIFAKNSTVRLISNLIVSTSGDGRQPSLQSEQKYTVKRCITISMHLKLSTVSSSALDNLNKYYIYRRIFFLFCF